MDLDVIRELSLDRWTPLAGQPELVPQQEEPLESGCVLYLPHLGFGLEPDERRFLDTRWSDGKAKNISYRGADRPLSGAQGSEEEMTRLHAMIGRFVDSSSQLVNALFPRYRDHLQPGFASFRAATVEGRKTSWRKDDTRLHVDAFPSNPSGGLRLLRLFTNINPHGQPRVWRIGEPFSDLAHRFFPHCSRPLPGSGWLLHQLGITKSIRTPYDHYMGQLHDRGKADQHYQARSPQITFEFPAGSSWIVYSDQVQHAVMSGQFMLEQTFYLDPKHLVHPEAGPLGVLESIVGRPLR